MSWGTSVSGSHINVTERALAAQCEIIKKNRNPRTQELINAARDAALIYLKAHDYDPDATVDVSLNGHEDLEHTSLSLGISVHYTPPKPEEVIETEVAGEIKPPEEVDDSPQTE